MITVYARKELTTDSTTLDICKAQGIKPTRMDVMVYHDKAARKPFARFGWYSSTKPSKRNKYVTINCFRYKLEWINK